MNSMPLASIRRAISTGTASMSTSDIPLVLNFWHSLLAAGTALSAMALGLIEILRFYFKMAKP
jgi:hypothetical protein